MKRYIDFINERYKYGKYQDVFINKLNTLYPNGLKLYHITNTDNVDNIIEHGLKLEYVTKYDFIHTTLGTYDIGRLSASKDGYSVFSIDIKPSGYNLLQPEEATYYEDIMDDYEDDEKWDYLFKLYMDNEPKITGGDISIYDDIPPTKISLVERN